MAVKHLQVAIVGKENDSFDFEFQYQSDAESAFYVLKEAQDGGATHKFAIIFTDGLEFSFDAYVSVSLNAVSVGESLKFKANLTPASEIEIKVPTFGA